MLRGRGQQGGHPEFQGKQWSLLARLGGAQDLIFKHTETSSLHLLRKPFGSRHICRKSQATHHPAPLHSPNPCHLCAIALVSVTCYLELSLSPQSWELGSGLMLNLCTGEVGARKCPRSFSAAQLASSLPGMHETPSPPPKPQMFSAAQLPACLGSLRHYSCPPKPPKQQKTQSISCLYPTWLLVTIHTVPWGFCGAATLVV